MLVRPETPDDIPAIRALLLAAFDGGAEAPLVDNLRADGDAWVSLVAEDGGVIIGHVMLSPMRAPARSLGLAPLAVVEGARRRGVGAALTQAAIARADESGWEAVFVLGDPAYYPRFGFSAEAAAPFSTPFAGPYFMALELGQGLTTRSGPARYAAAFDLLG